MKNRVDEIQHGGKHYKTDYQHWNLLPNLGFGLEYYLGCATKYITRHASKNGRQDVEKAIHFVQKATELVLEGKATLRLIPQTLLPSARFELERYAHDNGLLKDGPEFGFISHLLLAKSTLDFGTALRFANEILDAYPLTPEPLSPVFKPVPGGQYQQEGWWGDGTTLLKCSKCRTYFRMRETENPDAVHQCPVFADDGEPTPEYVDQDR